MADLSLFRLVTKDDRESMLVLGVGNNSRELIVEDVIGPHNHAYGGELWSCMTFAEAIAKLDLKYLRFIIIVDYHRWYN